MSSTADIAAYVKANPGADIHAIYRGTGATTLGARNSTTSLVSKMLKSGTLRHNNRPLRKGRGYFLTESALAGNRGKAKSRKPDTPKPKAVLKAKPPKPTKAADMTIVRSPAPPMKAPATVAPQTVDEFIAAGGRIEILHPHACSPNSILRFDYTPKPHASARPMTATRVRPSASR